MRKGAEHLPQHSRYYVFTSRNTKLGIAHREWLRPKKWCMAQSSTTHRGWVVLKLYMFGELAVGFTYGSAIRRNSRIIVRVLQSHRGAAIMPLLAIGHGPK